MKSGRTTALAAALKLLSYRPRSVKELGDRLKEKGFEEEEINSASGYLIKTGYLDDEKFASLIAESRIRHKGWGPKRIASYLRTKGVGADIIQRTLLASSAPESETADRALGKWLAKNGLRPRLEKKDLARAYRHLAARGFSAHVIMERLKSLKGDTDFDA